MGNDENEVITITKEYLESNLEDSQFESIGVDSNGQIDKDLFEEISEEIRENVWEFIFDCFSAVERRRMRDRRNKDAENENPHYVVYWRNENAYQPSYKRLRAFRRLADAWDFTHDGIYCGVGDEFKFMVVNDGVESDLPTCNRQFLCNKNYAL